jgi:tetratricopeptide (TPR) repeat protein
MPGERDYMRGVQLALAGDHEGAIEAFKRSLGDDPAAIDPALGLLDAYRDAGRLGEADDLAASLLRRAPDDEGVIRTVARLREQQGRTGEALDLLHRSVAHIDASGHDYPVVLRLLLAARRFDDALRVAKLGFDSLWRVEARLARGVAEIETGHEEAGVRTLAEIDATEFADLIDDWAQSLRYSNAAQRFAEALNDVSRRFPGVPSLAAIQIRLASPKGKSS